MWRRYLRFLGRDIGADVEEELRFHLEMRERDYVARGLDPRLAREEAMRRFGDVEAVRREVEEVDRSVYRTIRRRDWWDGIRQDVRYGIRTLGRSPGFTLVAVLTLGLGIGATAAIFSIVNAVLLKPLPYEAPERVVEVVNRWEGEPEGRLSPLEFFDYRERLRSFESMGAYATGPANLTGDAAPERLEVGYLTDGVFQSLRVAPELGRTFGADEDRPGGERVAVLGHGLWTRRYGGSEQIVGESIQINGRSTLVIGVMPADFRIPAELDNGTTVDLYMPFQLDRTTIPNRGSHFLLALGRLAPGVGPQQAAMEIERVAAEFVTEFPEDYSRDMQFGASVRPLTEAVLGDVRPLMLLLAGAVALVLLVACTNVANLLLVRADGRRRELAVRSALGASRARVTRQLLVESLMLAAAGGVLGVALATAALWALPLVQPPHLPRLSDVRMDWAVLAFATGVSLATALLFGLVPAIQAARGEVHPVLRESGRTSTPDARRSRMRGALVVGEIAMAVVLLIGAGLLLRSLIALNRVDPGFRTENVLTMRVTLPSSDYPDDDGVVRFYRESLDQIAALPGVEAAGAVSNLPLATSLGDLNFQIEGREVPEGETQARADYQAVTPDYFDAVGMRLVRGRGVEPSDDENAPGAIVLNEAVANRYWPGEDPIGVRLLLGAGAGPGWVTVVGIVADVRHASLTEPPNPEMYIPHAQFRHWSGGEPIRSLSFAVRTSGDPTALVSGVRAELRRVDPDLPLAEVRPLAEIRADTVAQPRFIAFLLISFASLALILAAIGVYGTLAYLVAQRTGEIGVRMALGAGASGIARMIVGQGIGLALVGAALGIAAALGLARLLEHLLFGVATTDPFTFIAVPATLVVVAALAAYLPARRATRVDPLVALRAD